MHFYEPDQGHRLPHDPIKAIVAPRPIGWISTRHPDGSVNLAPYSFFNMFSSNPVLVWFSSESEKDSVVFARESGEFCVNLVSFDLMEKMVASSVDAPRGVSEFGYAGLTEAPARLVAAPMVAEAHAVLECKVTEIRQPQGLGGRPSRVHVVTGEVVGVHIDEAMLVEGLFDARKAGNVARLGYFDYSAITELHQRHRPRWTERKDD